jgi:hypothetical protein
LWPCEEAVEAILLEPRKFRTNKQMDGIILFSNVFPHSPELSFKAEEYEEPPHQEISFLKDPRFLRYAFSYENAPTHEALEEWAEKQIRCKPDGSFRHSIECIIMKYCDLYMPFRLPKVSETGFVPDHFKRKVLTNEQ